MRSIGSLAMTILLAAAPAVGQEAEVGGSVVGEVRGFFGTPAFPGQLDTLQPSVTLEPYFTLQSDSGTHRFTLEPFFRLDGQDGQRTRFDLLEAYWHGVFGDVEVLAGVDRVFWGVTESTPPGRRGEPDRRHARRGG